MNAKLLSWLLLLSACLLAGCPQSVSDPPPDPPEAGYRHRPIDDLPEVEDYLPPLDDGRVQVAGPVGWKPLPRSSRSLASFVKGKASELPRISVTVGDPPAADLGDTTEANAETLAAALDSQVASDATKVVPEACLPIILGDRVFIRHVRLATMAGDPAVIQSLQTIAGGRLYTVELICFVNAPDRRQYEKSLKDYRDEGYAVAAHMKFGGAADPLAEVPAEKPPPVETLCGGGVALPKEAQPNEAQPNEAQPKETPPKETPPNENEP
jgi:hypothetical protein